MYAFIKSLSLFCVVFALLATCTDYGLRHVLTLSQQDDLKILSRIFRGNEAPEILVAGSSRALVHFDCGLIEDETGVSCLNIGLNGTHLSMQTVVLNEYMRKNSPPKRIIISVDPLTFSTPSNEVFDGWQYLPFVLKNKQFREELYALDAEYTLGASAPLISFSLNPKSRDVLIRDLFDIPLMPRDLRRDDYGYRSTTREWDGTFEKFVASANKGIKFEINKQKVSHLRDMIIVLKKKGVNVDLVYSPLYNELGLYVTNLDEIRSTYQMIAEETGVTYLDYSDYYLSKDKSKFYNSTHLNSSGSNLFSRDLIPYISQRMKD